MVEGEFKSTLSCVGRFSVRVVGGGCGGGISAGCTEPLPEPAARSTEPLPSGSAAKRKLWGAGGGGGGVIINHRDNNDNVVELVVPCGDDLMYVKWNYICR